MFYLVRITRDDTWKPSKCWEKAFLPSLFLSVPFMFYYGKYTVESPA